MEKIFDQTQHTKWYISDNGEVFSLSTWRKDKSKISLVPKKSSVNKKRGYIYSRTKNGNYAVHRLVAQCFIENPQDKPCVNHVDGNKLNNHKNNLEWVSFKENMDHAKRLGLFHPLKKNQGANLKYTNEQCKSVIENVKLGMTYLEAGKPYLMPYSTVAHLIRKSRRQIC